MSELYLMHHGIKGQKWGVRRYQNEDGTLTDAGRKRYSVDSETGKMSKEGKANYKNDNWKVRRHNRIERYTNNKVFGIKSRIKKEGKLLNKISNTSDEKKLSKLNTKYKNTVADRKMQQALQKLQHKKIDSFTAEDIKAVKKDEAVRYALAASVTLLTAGAQTSVVMVPKPTVNYLTTKDINKVANKYGKESTRASYTGYNMKKIKNR